MPATMESTASPDGVNRPAHPVSLQNFGESDGESSTTAKPREFPTGQDPRLRYCPPYWWPYQTYAKDRWIGRQLLEVMSTEFRDRSVDYYRHALESGVTRVNGVIASPEYVLKGGDRLDNTVHRHEPPVANEPVRILHIDREREFIVISKPGSVPVHVTGRYFRHTVLEMLKSDYDIHGYAVNRLDRLTSGLMILGLTSRASRDLAMEFQNRDVQKEYVARVQGRFPEEEITVEQPLLTVDRQMGLVIVAPQGRDAKTVFTRIGYDAERDQSIVRCKPLTGRTHQIRVHLQYLGHPISNDPLYGLSSVWGKEMGKGGVDLIPEDASISAAELIVQRHFAKLSASDQAGTSEASTPATPYNDSDRMNGIERPPDEAPSRPRKKADGAGAMAGVDEKEMGNIEISSPILLSRQAKEIIARLRRIKDEAEDWVKWKEVVFNAKEAQMAMEAQTNDPPLSTVAKPLSALSADERADPTSPIHGAKQKIPLLPGSNRRLPLPKELPQDHISPLRRPAYVPPGFCDRCFNPLPFDPEPETLFIYLHALSYTTEKLGKWETPLPRWAMEEWDGDWRGWADGQELPDALATGTSATQA